jgi:release factor glutamine methyltransferase
MVVRRVAGHPLEHVLRWAEFCGIRVTVAPGVFVPRPRTAFLVAQAALLVGAAQPADESSPSTPVVVDLCCGSGAVGVAIASTAGPVELHAADVDPVAIRCASENLAAFNGRVYEGDLFAALPDRLRGQVDVLVANAPYVPTAQVGLLPPEARLHEPGVALDGGADGLDVVRRILGGAGAWLAEAGHLLVETSTQQAPLAAGFARTCGLTARVVSAAGGESTLVIAAIPR